MSDVAQERLEILNQIDELKGRLELLGQIEEAELEASDPGPTMEELVTAWWPSKPEKWGEEQHRADGKVPARALLEMSERSPELFARAVLQQIVEETF